MRLSEIAYNLLLRTMGPMRRVGLLRVWDRLWTAGLQSFHGPVSTVIHGRRVRVNYGYTYPMQGRRYFWMNAPLVELAWLTWRAADRPIRFVDVGAAVGDTVLLLYGNLPTAFSGFDCIDGDPEFLSYLTENLKHLEGGSIHSCILSAAEESVPSLVRTHAGTASAQGAEKVRSTTLSRAITSPIDLLKIDVDGFDGRVLRGAMDLLLRDRPTVIFEWHPILCRAVENSWTEHFESLSAAGYSRFVWFNKFGEFSHFAFTYDRAGVDSLAEFCLSDVPRDWHYDVVALHDTSEICPRELAALRFAAQRPSHY